MPLAIPFHSHRIAGPRDWRECRDLLGLQSSAAAAVDLDFVKEHLPGQNGATEKAKQGFASPKTIISAVSKITGVRSTEILSDTRQAEIVLPRQIVMYILRNECKMGLIDIASALNRKDHTTVMHAVTKMEVLYPQNEKLREQIMLIKKEVWG